MNFSQRSYQKELLDGENIPAKDLYQNLKELAIINSYLGGFAITVHGVSQLVNDKKRNYHIVDIGCGGGDNMIAVAQWAKKNNISVNLTGIDLKKDAIDYAKQNCAAYPNIKFIESDYKLVAFADEADIIMSSLFCHHLNEKQIVECTNWMHKNARIGFVINDLERNKIAYYSIKWLTKFFSSSYLVKNDAAVSVTRGFKKQELNSVLDSCIDLHYKIKWKWAFRYLVIAKKV